MIVFPDVCKDCVPPKRNPHCHGTCKEYKDAKAAHEAKLAQAQKESRGRIDALDIADDTNTKIKKKHNDRRRWRWWK